MIQLNDNDLQEYNKTTGIKTDLLIDFGLGQFVFNRQADYDLYNSTGTFEFNNIAYNTDKTVFYLVDNNQDGYFITPAYIIENVKQYVKLEFKTSIDVDNVSYIQVSTSDDGTNWTDWQTIDIPYQITEIQPQKYIRFKVNIQANNIGLQVYGFNLLVKYNYNVADVDGYWTEKQFNKQFKLWLGFHDGINITTGIPYTPDAHPEYTNYDGRTWWCIPFLKGDTIQHQWVRLIIDTEYFKDKFNLDNQQILYGIWEYFNGRQHLSNKSMAFGYNHDVKFFVTDSILDGDLVPATIFENELGEGYGTTYFGYETHLQYTSGGTVKDISGIFEFYHFIRFTDNIEPLTFQLYNTDPNPLTDWSEDVYIPDNYNYVYDVNLDDHNPIVKDVINHRYIDIILIPKNIPELYDYVDDSIVYYSFADVETIFNGTDLKQVSNHIITMNDLTQKLTQKGIDKFALSNIDMVAEIDKQDIPAFMQLKANLQTEVMTNIYFTFVDKWYLFFKGLIDTKTQSIYNSNQARFTLYDITKQLLNKAAGELLKDSSGAWYTNKNVYYLTKNILTRSHLLDTSKVKPVHYNNYVIENLFDYWNEYNSEYIDTLKGTDSFYVLLTTAGSYYVLNNWQLDILDDRLVFADSVYTGIDKNDYTYIGSGHVTVPYHDSLNNYMFYYLVFIHNTDDITKILFVRLDKNNKTFTIDTHNYNQKSNNINDYLVSEIYEYNYDNATWQARTDTIKIIYAFRGEYSDYMEWDFTGDLTTPHNVYGELPTIDFRYHEITPVQPFKATDSYVIGFIPTYKLNSYTLPDITVSTDWENSEDPKWRWYFNEIIYGTGTQELYIHLLKYDFTYETYHWADVHYDIEFDIDEGSEYIYDTEDDAIDAGTEYMEDYITDLHESTYLMLEPYKAVKYIEGVILLTNKYILSDYTVVTDDYSYYIVSYTNNVYGNRLLNSQMTISGLTEKYSQYNQLPDITVTHLKPEQDLSSITGMSIYNQLNYYIDNGTYPVYVARGSNNKIYERKLSNYIIKDTAVFAGKNGFDIISQLAVSGAYFWGVTSGTIFFTDEINSESFTFDDTNIIKINTAYIDDRNYANIIKINGKVWDSSNNTYNSTTFTTIINDTANIKKYGTHSKTFTLDYIDNQADADLIANRIYEKIKPYYLVELEVKYTPQLDILDSIIIDLNNRLYSDVKYITMIKTNFLKRTTTISILTDNIDWVLTYGISTYQTGIL